MAASPPPQATLCPPGGSSQPRRAPCETLLQLPCAQQLAKPRDPRTKGGSRGRPAEDPISPLESVAAQLQAPQTSPRTLPFTGATESPPVPVTPLPSPPLPESPPSPRPCSSRCPETHLKGKRSEISSSHFDESGVSSWVPNPYRIKLYKSAPFFKSSPVKCNNCPPHNFLLKQSTRKAFTSKTRFARLPLCQ